MPSREVLIRKYHLELKITFDDDSLIDELSKINFLKYDSESKSFRTLPFLYWKLIKKLEAMRIKYRSLINQDYKSNNIPDAKIKLRDYQKDIYNKLKYQNYRGLIVLPTGAGKTILAIKLISDLKYRTLIVVPTIDLLEQWIEKIANFFNIEEDLIGKVGAGTFKISDITVATYVSVSKNDFLRRYMDHFGILVFDEAHHLAAKTFREIGRRLIAPIRVGLTATPSYETEQLKILRAVVGDIIHGEEIVKLVEKGYLAKFEYKKIKVSLDEDERKNYINFMEKYKEYVNETFRGLRGIKAFKAVLAKASTDPFARDALKARLKALKIAYTPKKKIELLEKLLSKHKRDKVLIFCRYRDIVEEISYLFGIPAITGEKSLRERKETLQMFKNGEVTKIVTAEVLDEGVDVPDASVAIIISGRGSSRQFIQRIGRIIRPKKDKIAKIYELITRGTIEEYLSSKRKLGGKNV